MRAIVEGLEVWSDHLPQVGAVLSVHFHKAMSTAQT